MQDIEEVKNRTDIVDFISQYLTLKKSGANYKALCPFHQEKTPSFMVSSDKQIFRCFGCGAGGDVIEFLMKMENLEFPEALGILADKAGVQISKKKSGKVYQEERTQKNELYRINQFVAQVYHKILTSHKLAETARKYLVAREISPKTINKFLIGFAPQKTVVRDYLIKKGFSQSSLKLAGHPEKFFERIIFPIFDTMGNPIGFTGRVLADNSPTSGPKYLNTPETEIFHKSRILYALNFAKNAIRQKKAVIVAEGQMDVILSHQAGVENIVASSGTALTENHLKILGRYSENVIFCFDADSAGEAAAEKAIALSLSLGINCKIISMPKGVKDIGELAQKNPQAWQSLSQKPVSALEWFLDKELMKYPNLSIEAKKSIAKKILPLVKIIPDKLEQEYWIKTIAKKLDTSVNVIIDALAKYQLIKNSQVSEKVKKSVSAEKNLVALLLAYPKEISPVAAKLDYQEFSEINPQKIYKIIQSCYTKGAVIDHKFINCLREDLKSFIKSEVLDVENKYKDFQEIDIKEDIKKIITRIKEKNREKIKQNFSKLISAAEEKGDISEVRRLLKELQNAIH